MTPGDWAKVDAAFERALALEGDELRAFLEQLASAKPDVAQEVLKLLEADQRSDEAILSPIAATVLAMSRDATDPFIGRRFGDWTVRKRIAVGGMGAVFLAQRSDDNYEQLAAIKVMASQLVAPGAVARFRAERQILANLNHPYIAKLLDGGATDEGLPYLTLEYVSGLPIDRYCDHHRLGIEQRLRLFQKVCQAVDYAHRQLVVHRDLKPSNILVNENGDPQLLDFGIAKLLDAESWQQTIAVTREGSRALTPDYASPEQVRGDPVSVATDVYALGILLYKLLSGRTPFDTVRGEAANVVQAILDEEPSRPSAAITQRPTDVSPDLDVSELRSTSFAQLKSAISGDLDNIVLMALRKEPERRYATAADLSEDVDNYLEHRPVAARREELVYSARKFVRRHRVGVLVALAAAVLSSAAVVQIVNERNRAEREAARASEVSAFMTRLFDSASPFVGRGTEVTARQVLDEGVARIEELGNQPGLQGELYLVMGRNYTALGYLDEAIELLEAALAQKLREDNALAIAEVRRSLAEAFRQRREFDRALDLQHEVLEAYAAEYGRESDPYAKQLVRQGIMEFDHDNYDEAVASYAEALAIKERLGTDDDPETADLLGNYGNVVRSLGDFEKATELMDRAIDVSIRVDGRQHPDTIIRMHNRGMLALAMGELDDGARRITEAIELGRATWPEHHPQVWFMVGTLGDVRKRQGEFAAARALYEEEAASIRARLGENNLDYVGFVRAYGFLLRDMAQYEAAEQAFREGLEILAGLDAGDSRHYNILHLGIAMTLNRRGRYREAEAHAREALRGRDHLSRYTFLIVQNHLADALSRQGRRDEAEALLTESLLGARELVGNDSATLLGYLRMNSQHFRRYDELETARAHIEDAVRIADLNLPLDNWTSALVHAERGYVLLAQNDVDAGRAELEAAEATLADTFGADDPRASRIREALAELP